MTIWGGVKEIFKIHILPKSPFTVCILRYTWKDWRANQRRGTHKADDPVEGKLKGLGVPWTEVVTAAKTGTRNYVFIPALFASQRLALWTL